MEKVVTLINPLADTADEPVSIARTTRGEPIEFRNGEFTTTDSGLARDLQQSHPYLLDAPHDVFHPGHPMRVTTIGVPWGNYDELGRRLPNDLDTQGSA